MVTDDILYQFACQLRDALLIAMDKADALPVRLSLTPSPVPALDVCCSDDDGDGMAWVSMVRGRQKNALNQPCGSETEMLFLVGIARCSPTIGDDQMAPSGAELDEASMKMYRDYRIMRHAIQGIWAPEMQLEKDDYRLGDYSVHAVRGGCQAASQEVYVDFACLPYNLECS
jgi:hypothetical protein